MEYLHSIEMIRIEELKTGTYQPRRKMDPQSVKELSQSIAQQGLLHPITVRPIEQEGGYEILAGHCRTQAVIHLGWEKIPAVVMKANDNALSAQIALVENLQRQELKPLDIALALEHLQGEFGYSHHEMAAIMGKKRSTITNYLRLLQLSPKVQAALDRGELSMAHAKLLAGMESRQQEYWVDRLSYKKWSAHQFSKALKRTKKKKTESCEDLELTAWIDCLEAHLGMKVLVTPPTNTQMGRLELRFAHMEDLEFFFEKLKLNS